MNSPTFMLVKGEVLFRGSRKFHGVLNIALVDSDYHTLSERNIEMDHRPADNKVNFALFGDLDSLASSGRATVRIVFRQTDRKGWSRSTNDICTVRMEPYNPPVATGLSVTPWEDENALSHRVSKQISAGWTNFKEMGLNLWEWLTTYKTGEN